MSQTPVPTLAPLIALVGADGSGKSTLAPDLLAHVARTRPAQMGYLGLGSGPLGTRIKAWPLIGPPLERLLSERARRARDPEGTIPDVLTALVLYRYSLKRKRRWDQMMALRLSGTTVITDRYPQAEVAGFYDGPGLSAARAGGAFVPWLAARELRLYTHMASFVPTLVIRLNIDIETAMLRKPDHERSLLERKIAVTPTLRFGGAPFVEIDASQPYTAVLALAKVAVDRALAALEQP
ncbi:MAG: nucleoside triphosphate hydrolase [Sphingopyxis sp.]